MRLRGIVRKADARIGFVDCPAVRVVRFDRSAIRGKSTRRLLGRRVELSLARENNGAVTAKDVVVLPVPYKASVLYAVCIVFTTLFFALLFAPIVRSTFWLSLLSLNAAAAMTMWLDKLMANLDWSTAPTWQLSWVGARAPESMLLTLAACGASPTIYASVFYFRHKLYKERFAQTFQTIVVVQILVLSAQLLFTLVQTLRSL